MPYPCVINLKVSFTTKLIDFCNYLFGNLFVWLSAVNIGDTAETYVIDAEHFSGTYKLVGDTVLRNQKTGKDEAFQVTIPNLKFTSNLELGFAAEGDPSTTTFECEVMRDTDTGAMIQMVKY